jgi:quercetin dioxygenase-like cupin family protein
MTDHRRGSFVSAPGDGGVLADAGATGGALGVADMTIDAGHSSPRHVHPNEDEAFYVLTGTVDFTCGADRARVTTGGFAHLPRAVPHTFVGVAPRSRVLVLFVPAGLEAAFAEPARFAEVMAARGVELVR